MISDAKFNSAIALLQEHFNRTLPEKTIAIWREYFNENLTDEQLTRGIKLAIVENKFMPTAKEVVDLSKQDGEMLRAYEVRNALPSAEMRMSEEERLENIRKLKAMWSSRKVPGNPEQKVQERQEYKEVAQKLIQQWKEQGLID